VLWTTRRQQWRLCKQPKLLKLLRLQLPSQPWMLPLLLLLVKPAARREGGGGVLASAAQPHLPLHLLQAIPAPQLQPMVWRAALGTPRRVQQAPHSSSRPPLGQIQVLAAAAAACLTRRPLVPSSALAMLTCWCTA
jgi:hypothetical protein